MFKFELNKLLSKFISLFEPYQARPQQSERQDVYIDDEEVILDSRALILIRLRCKVEAFTSAEKAIKQSSNLKQIFALITRHKLLSSEGIIATLYFVMNTVILMHLMYLKDSKSFATVNTRFFS